jgi:hypothetical protein
MVVKPQRGVFLTEREGDGERRLGLGATLIRGETGALGCIARFKAALQPAQDGIFPIVSLAIGLASHNWETKLWFCFWHNAIEIRSGGLYEFHAFARR